MVSLAASSYYGHDQGLVVPSQHGTGGGSSGPHSPGKYQENGHDTFSDFVTLVCQEAQNTQNAQVVEGREGRRRKFKLNKKKKKKKTNFRS